MKIKNILAILEKEVTGILRDRSAFLMAVLLPGVLLILYGFAVNLDVNNIPTVVFDLDKSSESRELLSSLESSGYFSLAYTENRGELDAAIRNGQAKVALSIPPDFAEKLKAAQESPIQAFVDGSNNNTALIASGYLSQMVAAYSNRLRVDYLERVTGQRMRGFPPIQPEVRVWYNPRLKSTFFIVPGVVALIMMIVGTNSTAISVVLEREQGTYEKLLVTPLHRFEIIIGKATPWAILAVLESIFAFLLGILIFRVPMRGSWLLLTFGCLLYLYCATSFGLLISSLARTQQAAIFIAILVSLLPTFLLSGFVFPIASMPVVLRYLTYIVPARYFMEIIRGIFLKQSGLAVLWPQFLTIAGMGFGLNLLTVRRFHRQLD